MKNALLPKYIFSARYGRHDKEKKRRKVWEESVGEMFGMHRRHASELMKHTPNGFAESFQAALDAAEAAVVRGEVLGSQRALQYGGDPVLKHNAKSYNCSFSLCDRPRFFQEAFYLLLCGTGVGFSVQKQHVDQLPHVGGPSGQPRVHVVEDSIEGWADAAGELLASYFYQLSPVEFDFSQVRPKGAPISSGAGRAPGPEPLQLALVQIRSLLDRCIGKKLRPIDAYDITMFIADSVRSGGIRRSATLALCSLDDEEMRNAKVGDWFKNNPQRARSNNSVVIKRGTLTKELLRDILGASQGAMGDLGIHLTDNFDWGVNPCAEIGLNPVLTFIDGRRETGWAFCNLTEINGVAVTDFDKGMELASHAAVIGTIQAAYTSFPYLGEVSEEIAKRDALLGVSITGIMDNPRLMDQVLLSSMARQVRTTNKVCAALLGINESARATCVKPSGKASLLLGVSAGIHARKGARTIRRVQADLIDAPTRFLQEKLSEHGLHEAIEPGAWGTDLCFYFAERAPMGAKLEDEMSALDQLEAVRFFKEHWVNNGHARGDETHNVSNTLYVDDHEWEEVADFILEHEETFNSLSFQRGSSPHEWPQTPTIQVETLEGLVNKYGPVFVEIAMERWLERPQGQTVWDFAKEHDKPGSLLHHEVALYAIYERLMAVDPHIDFTELVEEEDETRLGEMLACAGGSCVI